MQQVAEFALWFLLGALAYTGIHLTIVEWRESKRLAKSMEQHPTGNYSQVRSADAVVYPPDYSNLDRLDGLLGPAIAHMEADKAIQERVRTEIWRDQ